jgi:hypothetical protein
MKRNAQKKIRVKEKLILKKIRTSFEKIIAPNAQKKFA